MTNRNTNATGWVYSELYMWHDTGRHNLLHPPSLTNQPGEHAENPETKRRFSNLVEVSSLADELVRIKPRPAAMEELLRFHTAPYLEFLDDLCKAGGGLAGAKTPAGPASFDIAALSAGGVLASVDAVATGEIDNAYVLCRPPGHHAEQDQAIGFCLLANGVLAVEHARAAHGFRKIAVIDWDVHHGNGAETAFYSDPDVLTISLHQDNLFPRGRGLVCDAGAGEAVGFNLNIPLPPGSGGGAYSAAFDRVVVPALDQFAPEMIFVASGFDASAYDPLGHMMLSSNDFRHMTEKLLGAAARHAAGRIVMHHEGGYSAAYVPYCGLAVLEALSGQSARVEDPFLSSVSEYGGQPLQPHQEKAIAAAAANL